MALPSSGQISFADIAAEYGQSLSNVQLSKNAGLNAWLPTSATAEAKISDYYYARRGPDTITLTRAAFVYLGNFSGYTSSGQGAVTSRSINEGANRLEQITSSGGVQIFKANNYTGYWKIKYNGIDKGSGTWVAADNWYRWNTAWWADTATGNVTIQYLYNN